MKTVTIILENKEKIHFTDYDDDTPLEEYIEKLKQLYEISNITILTIGNKSCIIRPSKIYGISVDDNDKDLNALADKVVNQIEQSEKDEAAPEQSSEEPQKIEEQEDVIEEEEDVITD